MQTLKVFVSSPGDVREEREIVGRVVERIEARYWNFVRLDSVLWESELVRATGHFNEEIVRPSECDVVLSVLWRRLGSLMPPQFLKADGTRFQSGTEWEIEDAVAGYEARRRAKAEGKSEETPFPDVLIFRRMAPAPGHPAEASGSDDSAEQAQKLDAFWRRFMLHPDGTIRRAFHAYATLEEFQHAAEAQLEKAVVARLPRLTATQEVLKPIPLQGSPFKGLAAFEAADAPLFFGREKSAGEVLRQLRAQADKGNGGAFLLIYGGSGSGKSSLMRAGIGPRITQPGWLPGVETWWRATLLPGQGEGALTERLAHALLAALPQGTAAEGLAQDFSLRPATAAARIHAALAAEAAAAGRLPTATRLLVEIDQLEEAFTAEGFDDAGRDAFFAALAALAEGGAWVIATMRSEFFPRIARHPDLLRLVRAAGGGYILTPPRPEDLARMVRCPAMAAGLGFQRHPETAQDLSEEILEKAGRNPEALPLLQFCLQRLWEQRDERALVWAAYTAMGGLEGAIARAAGEVFAALQPHEQEAGRHVFAELVQVGGEDDGAGSATRRRAPLEAAQAIAPGAARFIAAFVDAKLLATDGTATGARVMLAHEALLTHWPELARWVEANRRLLAARGRLETAAAEWTQAGEDRGLLLRDRRLRDAEDVQESALFALRADERALLGASRQLQRRGVRIRQGVLVGALVLAAAASVAAVLAVQNATRATSAEQTAVAQRDRADGEAKAASEQRDRAVAAREGAEELVEFMTFKLRDQLEPIGRLSLMTGINEKVEAYHRRFAREDDPPELLRRRSALYQNQAISLLSKGDAPGALARSREALAIQRRLVQLEPNNTLWLRDLSTCCDQAAMALSMGGDSEGALQVNRESLALRERLLQTDPSRPSAQRDVAISWFNVGAMLHARNELDQALEAYQKAVALFRRAGELDPADDGRHKLAVALNRVADMQAARGNLTAAVETIREALDLLELLRKRDPDNATWQRDLPMCHMRYGEFLQIQGNLDGAHQQHQAALEIYRRLAKQDPENAIWQRETSYVHLMLGDVQKAQGAPDEALASYRSALALSRTLAARDPRNALWQGDLSRQLYRIGDLLASRGNPDEALTHLREARAVLDKLIERDAAMLIWQIELCLAVTRIGDVLWEQNDLDGALATYQGARPTAELLARQDPRSTQLQNNLAVVWERLGKVQQRRQAWPEALAAFGQELAVVRPQMQATEAQMPWARLFAIAAGCRWEILRDAPPRTLGEADRAAMLEDLRRAVEALRQLDDRTGLDPAASQTYGWTCELLRLADAAEK